jgi:LPS O-antigen subunit length determinant protein (WzzB/FepE family)
MIILEGQKSLLTTNLELEELQLAADQDSSQDTKKMAIDFYSSSISTSLIREKSKTAMIIAISVVLGGMLGFFIAIGRIMVRNYSSKA